MPHVHDLPRAKDRGGGAALCRNKRRLKPAVLQGSAVGAYGKKISSFFAPDPHHHEGAYRPGQGVMNARSAEAIASSDAVVSRAEQLAAALLQIPAAVIQVGDLVANAQLKVALKQWAAEWRTQQLQQMGWPAGHVKLTLRREEIVSTMERIIAEFNAKQMVNPTIDKCFLKVGQDIFNDDLSKFDEYMTNLSEMTIYKTLIDAQTRADLTDRDDEERSRRRRTA